MKNIDDVLSSMVISLKIKTKEEKFILKTGLEVAMEMGKTVVLKAEIDSNQFLWGETDCQAGRPARDTTNESYNRGYATRYAQEQVDTYLSERSEQNVRPL